MYLHFCLLLYEFKYVSFLKYLNSLFNVIVLNSMKVQIFNKLFERNYQISISVRMNYFFVKITKFKHMTMI